MIRRLTGVLVAVVVIVAAAGTVAYRKVYGTWWQAPEHIAYCGRIFENVHGPALSRAEVDSYVASHYLAGEGPFPAVTVGKVPPIVGKPLVAAVNPEAARDGHSESCRMDVYLKTGEDAYSLYFASGGP